MKTIIIILLIITNACGQDIAKENPWDFNEESAKEEKEQVRVNEPEDRGESNEIREVANDDLDIKEEHCSVLLGGECQNLGAPCCNLLGTYCTGSEVGNRCMLPDYVQPFRLEVDTRGGLFSCLSSPEGDGRTTLSIVGEYGNAAGMIDIDVTRELLPQTTFDVENFEKKITQTAGALTLVFEEGLEVSAFYYQLKTTAVPGFRGVFRGEFRSLISDDIWEVSCWLKHIEPRAIYIEEENRCVDKFGEEARNPQIGMPGVRGTGFAECGDFVGIALGEEARNYQVLVGTNFRGSKLNGARIHFAHISEADFRGATLSTLDFGYSNIEGKVNQHTIFPDSCERGEERISCSN